MSPHCKRDIKNKANLVIRALRNELFDRLNYTAYILSRPFSVSTESAISAPHSGDKGELVMGVSRYASFDYLSTVRRFGSALCGYTGWPRVYKLYNSTVQMILFEESELQGLPCF